MRLKDAVDKMLLTDASVTYTQESSLVLGSGFRCGFLGLLHMDVFQQRLKQEFAEDVIVTAPTNTYKIEMTDGTVLTIENPNDFPTNDIKVKAYLEPWVSATIVSPVTYMGDIVALCQVLTSITNLHF